MKCSDCKYGHRVSPDQDWRCRKRPPLASQDHIQFHNRFPAVKPDDWCGGHEPIRGTARDYRKETNKYREELGACYREAAKLATYIVRTHYPDNKEWRPLDTLSGVLSQIDNAVTKWKADIIDFEKERSRWNTQPAMGVLESCQQG